MKKIKQILAGLFFCCILSEASDYIGDLGTIVITAERSREEIAKIPANVSVITSDEIEKSGATNIAEILEDLEGIHLRSTSGNASQSQIDMRGFGGDNPFGKTLVLLDGRRLNRPDMASINWLQISPNTVERIEVIRGANNVLYGDNAIAGVINIITKKGIYESKKYLSIMPGSYDLKNLKLGMTGKEAKLSYSVNAEKQSTEGYRDRTEFSSDGGNANFGYNINDSLTSSLDLSFNRTKFKMPGALTKSQMEENRKQAINPDDAGENEYINVNLGFEAVTDGFGRLDFNVLYGRKNIASNMASWPAFSDSIINTIGITPRYILEKDIYGYNNKFIFGIDYYTESLALDKYADRARTSKSSSAEIEKNSVGLYFNDKINLLENLILSAGARTEQAEIKAKLMDGAGIVNVDDEKKHDGNVFNLGIVYLPDRNSKIFTKFSTLYRYPFIDEQAVYSGFGPDKMLKDLESEKGSSFELGTEFHSFKNLKIGLTLFNITMKDEIAYNSATFQNENLDKTRHRGAELKASYKLTDIIKIYGNHTYSEAEFTAGQYSGKNIPLVPNHKTVLGLDILMPSDILLRPELSYTSDCYFGGDNTNTAEKLKGYSLFDFSLFYKPQIASLPLSVFLKAKNILNEQYNTFGYYSSWSGKTYYPSPERNFSAGVSLEF